jgi:predicted lipoprotein with Yx(FWY)xxD motif
VISLAKFFSLGGALALAIVLLLVPAMAEEDGYTIKIASDKFKGSYLVNQSGYALYYFQNDSRLVGDSSCYEECAATWPPFYAPELVLPEELRQVDFGHITRSDGSRQTTFRGWPLYQYVKDAQPGNLFGDGVEGLWHLIDPENQPQMI